MSGHYHLNYLTSCSQTQYGDVSGTHKTYRHTHTCPVHTPSTQNIQAYTHVSGIHPAHKTYRHTHVSGTHTKHTGIHTCPVHTPSTQNIQAYVHTQTHVAKSNAMFIKTQVHTKILVIHNFNISPLPVLQIALKQKHQIWNPVMRVSNASD